MDVSPSLADDVQKVETDQIVPVKVLGDWSVTRNVHYMRFCVKNAADIGNEISQFD